MSKEYLDYPKASVSFQGGELMDNFEVSIERDVGEQTVHTFRNKGEACGSTSGKQKTTVTLKNAIPETGMERDYFGNLRKRKVLNVRVKVPGKTISITGRMNKLSMSSAVDGFISLDIGVEGSSTES